MQIGKIQNNGYNSTFGAKLNINGEMFYGEVFDKMFEKASKIGTEKDVIDISYVGYFVGKSKKTGLPDKFKSTFVAKFLEKGKKTLDKSRYDLSDSTRYAYREKAKKAANDFIDNLFSKYVK